jgi:hypothetical protein
MPCGGWAMKKGYEGITIALYMLLTTWLLIAIAKFLF